MAYDIAFTLDSTLAAGRNVELSVVDPPQSVEVAPGSQVLNVPFPVSGAMPVFRFYEVRVTAKGESTMEYCAFSARSDYLGANSGWGCAITSIRQTNAATCTGALASGWNRSKPCAFQLRIQP
ncbi:hypothetical protein [Allostella humosa]|nr:hypothetical protein [Stella humosa]